MDFLNLISRYIAIIAWHTTILTIGREHTGLEQIMQPALIVPAVQSQRAHVQYYQRMILILRMLSLHRDSIRLNKLIEI